jgi:hypothetical protein
MRFCKAIRRTSHLMLIRRSGIDIGADDSTGQVLTAVSQKPIGTQTLIFR